MTSKNFRRERPYSRVGSEQELYVEDVSFAQIAKEYGTPTYVYSEDAIIQAFESYKNAFRKTPAVICVSAKANSNLSLLSMLAKRGAGFDVVSGGELFRVGKAGGDPKKTVFAGVGKSDDEIRFALREGIMLLNVESLPELERINELAKELNVKCPVAIRVNPDVDAKTHAYISTGLEQHKFGIPLSLAAEVYKSFAKYPNVEFAGVDCHIGSMITDLSAFQAAFTKLAAFVKEIRETVKTIRYLDIGGGLAVSYANDVVPTIGEYASVVEDVLADLGVTLVLEPGRSIFANAGVLLSQTVFVKRTSRKQFLVLDAGFNDLVRPVMYEAHHEIEPVKYTSGRKEMPFDVVGPICETGDCFASGRVLPDIERGELVAIFSAGAYGATMASNYNTRSKPAEVLVSGKNTRLIRARETWEDLVRDEEQLLAKS